MTKYSLKFFSHEENPLEVVSAILSSKTLVPLVFPLEYRLKARTFLFTNLETFDLDVIRHWEIEKGNPLLPDFIVFGFYATNTKLKLEFSLKATIGKPQTATSVTLYFDDSHLDQGVLSLTQLKQIAIEIIPIFKVTTARLLDRRTDLSPLPWLKTSTNIPFKPAIGWMSYFGRDTTNYIGRARFENLQTCAEKLELNDGFLVILHTEPYQYGDESHHTRERQALAELGL